MKDTKKIMARDLDERNFLENGDSVINVQKLGGKIKVTVTRWSWDKEDLKFEIEFNPNDEVTILNLYKGHQYED